MILLTNQGELIIRQLSTDKVVTKCSIKPLLSKNRYFENIWLSNSDNFIFVRIKNGGIYLWNQKKEAWNIYRKNGSFLHSILPDNGDLSNYFPEPIELSQIKANEQQPMPSTNGLF